MDNANANSIFSQFDNNDAINLLTQTIQILNDKIVHLNTDNNSLRNKLSEEQAQIHIISEKANMYESTTKELESIKKELGSTKETLSNLEIKYDNAIKESSEKQTQLKKDLDTEKENNKSLSQNLTEKQKELDLQNQNYSALEQKMYDLTERSSLLENRLKKVKIISEIRIALAKINANLETDDSITEWKDFKSSIIKESKALSIELQDTDISLECYISASNNWLTKLSSLMWWAEQSELSCYVNKHVYRIEIIKEMYKELLDHLKEAGFDIQLPTSGFERKIDLYEPNYTTDSIINKLFPEVEISEGMLCEIYTLAIKSENGTQKGKCLSLRNK